MTRTGKIARLPRDVRNRLNCRLQDGEPGKSLVEWLNANVLVQEVLKEHFGGRPVSEQNLSEWKAGGYQDWLRHEESRQLISGMAEEHQELGEAAWGREISDRFAGLLSVEFVTLTKKLLEEKTEPTERWQMLREVLGELSQLRRDDHRAVRTFIKRERWERECAREEVADEQELEKEHKERMCAPFWAKLQLQSMAELFGGGELGEQVAAFILETQNGLSPGQLGSRRHKPGPSESDPIKPNQAS